MGETVGEKSPEVSRVFSKDPPVNLEHFDTNLMAAADCGYMAVIKKPSKKWFYVGWNCVSWAKIK